MTTDDKTRALINELRQSLSDVTLAATVDHLRQSALALSNAIQCLESTLPRSDG